MILGKRQGVFSNDKGRLRSVERANGGAAFPQEADDDAG
jgi:hypothetical protein